MTAKSTTKKARYLVLRDCAIPATEPGGQGTFALAGDAVELDPAAGALMARDGMVAPIEGT